MLERILALFQGNELLSGGALLMVLGWIGFYLRAVPRFALSRLRDYFMTHIQLDSNDQALEWMDRWWAEKVGRQRIRTLRLLYLPAKVARDLAPSGGAPTSSSEPLPTKTEYNLRFIPGLGVHWTWYRNRPLIMQRDRKRREWGGFDDQMQLTYFSRDLNVLHQLLDEARQLSQPDDNRVVVAFNVGGSWSYRSQPPRSLDSVILPGGQLEELVGDLTEFLDAEQRYQDRGIPYRRAYLLHGLGGTGKTSLVRAIACHFKRPLYVYSAANWGTASTQELWANVPENAIMLWEDFDVTIRAAEKTSESESAGDAAGEAASFRTVLLNLLDGVASSHGRILFMTANRPSTFDQVLLRPGRVDYQLPFGVLTEEQARRFLNQFFPKSPLDWDQADWVEEIVAHNWTMARLQGLCQRYWSVPERLAEGWEEFTVEPIPAEQFQSHASNGQPASQLQPAAVS